MFPIDPNLSYKNAIVKLNSLNLTNIWLVSTIFSYIDFFFDNPQSPGLLFPAIHGEHISLFQRAILESAAKDYKERYLTSSNYPEIHNNLINASYRPYQAKTKEKIEIVLDIFSKIGNNQFRYQQNQLSVRLGRIYAMYIVIPEKNPDLLRKKMGNNFIDFFNTIPRIINGLSSEQFLGIGFCIFSLIQARYNETLKKIEDTQSYINGGKSQEEITKRQFEVIGKIIDSKKKINIDPLVFSSSQASIRGSIKYSAENVSKYLSLLARTSCDLQTQISRLPEYNVGDLPDRLNPLERYPIIKIHEDGFFVPNARFCYDGISNLLHFILQDYFLKDSNDNKYHQQMGYIQEIFLKNLISEKLQSISLIPEISYMKGKNRVDGPDFTLLENETNRLIAIESKFKHVRNLARVAPLPKTLHEELSNIVSVIKKIDTKVLDMYFGFPEYGIFQEKINKTKENLPIYVVIIGEGIEFLSEIFFRGDLDTSITSMKNSICLMDVEAFEELVDYSTQEQIPLSELLDEYSKTSRSNDLQNPGAEYLYRDKISNEKRFSKQFTDIFLQELGKEF